MKTLVAVVLFFAACSNLFADNPKAVLVSKASIEYPEAAKRSKITGSGIYVLNVDRAGNVASVTIAHSAGSPILDAAAIRSFKKFKFKPGATAKVRVPATWSWPHRR